MSELEIIVNGKPRRVPPGARVSSLVDGNNCDGLAIARNGEVVRRAQWAEVELAHGDQIEIVRAVQGG